MSAAPDPNTQRNSPEDLNFQQLLYDKLKTRKLFKHSLLHLNFTKHDHVVLNSYFCYYGFVFSFCGQLVINCVLSGTGHVALNFERVSHHHTKIVGRSAHTWTGNIYDIHTRTP